jgi:hypothetical protein
MKRKFWLAGGVVVAVLIVVAIVLLRPYGEQEHPTTVIEVVNRVDAHPRPQDDWTSALVDMRIYGGGQIRTGAESSARLELLEGIVRLSGDSVFTVKKSTTQEGKLVTTLFLGEGRLWAYLTSDQPHEFTVETGSAVAAVRDTRFSVKVTDGTTFVSVAEGETMLTAQGQTVTVKAGEQATVESEQPSSPPEPMSDQERTLWAIEGEMPELAPPPEAFTNPVDFQAAISSMGTLVRIDFEDADASPFNNTVKGREPIDGNRYADHGITFSTPDEQPLYIAPGGLDWNASHSLSVGQFPFDTNAHDETNDSLLVTINPPAIAVGLTLIDNVTYQKDEFVEFKDVHGAVVRQIALPQDYTSFRAFVGIVSVGHPIAAINIAEAPDDGDDINYDDLILVQVQ